MPGGHKFDDQAINLIIKIFNSMGSLSNVQCMPLKPQIIFNKVLKKKNLKIDFSKLFEFKSTILVVAQSMVR